MGSLCDDNGLKRILVVVNGRRAAVRLGRCSQKQAQAALSHIEDLANAKRGGAVNAITAEWLGGLPDDLHGRLVKAGLTEPRRRILAPTVAEWVRQYIEGRGDVKGATATVYSHTERNLAAFFAKQLNDKRPGPIRLDEVTSGDADAFRVYLKTQEGLAENTVRRRIAIARQFFRAALRRKLMAGNNPFEGLPTMIQRNPKRFHFVTLEEAQAVLDACPSIPWKLVFSLARYGGLRIASEAVALRWRDVDWERSRFTVHAAKTEHHDGGGERIVPIFPELYPHLLAAYEAAEPGAEFCCPQFANPNQLYKKNIIRYVRAAGLTPWPKLFVNLRSTRSTELKKRFPSELVNQWIGHTGEIADRFYFQVEEDFFTVAAKEPTEAAQKAAHFPAQQRSPTASSLSQPIEISGEFAGTPVKQGSNEPSMGGAGLEPATLSV